MELVGLSQKVLWAITVVQGRVYLHTKMLSVVIKLTKGLMIPNMT